MEKLVILNDNDNVAVASEELKKDADVTVGNHNLKLLEDIPTGNKVALANLQKGSAVIKLGYSIGQLKKDVQAGQLINEDNLDSRTGQVSDKAYSPSDLSQYLSKKTFMGYRRKNGKVGIRNDLYIIPTVGCITPLMDVMVQQFKAVHPDNGSFDNIILLKHPYGCSQLGEDFEQTRQILCDAALQPNAGGILVFGLGCENNQMAGMKETIEKMEGINPNRMKFLVAQEVKDEFANAQQMLEDLNEAAKDDHREPIPLSELKVGLQSVKADNFAPLTSNRLLAYLANFINANGGTTVLSALPGLASAQAQLRQRANNEETAKDLDKIFNHLSDYYKEFDEELATQPTKVDKANGISTPEEQAVNNLQLGGDSQVTAGLEYGKKVSRKGLNLLEGPSNDLIVSSAEAAADCQMVITSTGAATPYASFAPSYKVASNSELAQKKPRWFDFDGGQVMDQSFESVAKKFVDQIIAVASGQKIQNEKSGLHGLAIFKIGVTE